MWRPQERRCWRQAFGCPIATRVPRELAAALPRASASAKAGLLEILGAVEGQKALEAIGAVMKGGDPELQDVGSRVLARG